MNNDAKSNVDPLDIEGMWNDDSTKPESNWFAFEKVGDSVGGELVMEPFDHEGKFGLQKVYVIKKSDGEEINVSLKHTSHKVQIQQLKGACVGDILAFRLKELVDVGKGNPAKSIEVRLRHINRS